ncbi:MAG: phosphate ABC transporter substrate-binding protein [Ruminococcaceae bacterium]|nr:phosphate ABC transporter substrate-binding protein [Oscillospiraceae bacterium]
MKNTKRIIGMLLIAALIIASLAGCGNDDESFDASRDIHVTSREEGSGTRGAFVELFGIEQKDEKGEKVDYTTPNAVTTNSTSVMMTTVAGDLYAIGYISMGSLNDTVKAVEIDGALPSAENIKNGTYKVSRPFNIVTTNNISKNAQDFIDFIMSANGQDVIEEAGYISVSDAPAYTGGQISGKVVVSGSSSVTPVMEKLKEAYITLNPDVTIEVQQSDSSTGITDAADGTCDIGMASRDLKDSETEQGLTATVIAMDGIAVIVNNDSDITALTSRQVMKIYTGEVTKWTEIK